MGHRGDLPDGPEGVLFALSGESVFTSTETSRADTGSTRHGQVIVVKMKSRVLKIRCSKKLRPHTSLLDP